MSWDPIGTIADHLIAHAALGLAPGSAPVFGTPLTLNGSQLGSDGNYACILFDNAGTTEASICAERFSNDAVGGLVFSWSDAAGDVTPFMRGKIGGSLDIGNLGALDTEYFSNLSLAPTVVTQTALTIQEAVGQTADLFEVVDDGGRRTTVINADGFITGPERASGFSDPLTFVGNSGSDGDSLNFDPSFLFRQDTGRGADYFMAFSEAATHAAWRSGIFAYMDNNGNLYKGRPESSFDATRITYLQSDNNIQTGPGANYIDFWSFDASPPAAPVQDVDSNCRLFVQEDIEGIDKLHYYDGNGQQVLVGGASGAAGASSGGAQTSATGDFIGYASDTLQTAEYTPVNWTKVIQSDNQNLLYGKYTIRSGATLEIESGGSMVIL